MKKTFKKFCLPIFLCMSLTLFAACENIPALAVPTPVPTPTPLPDYSQDYQSVRDYSGNLHPLFMVQWDTWATFNPYDSESTNNLALSGLLYESFFKVNPDFSWAPVLCNEYDTNDGVNWSFTIKPDVLFHDGSAVTLNDVLASINTAKRNGRFTSRLSIINKVSVADGKLNISLVRANYDFPALLNIPIVKDGTTYDQVPMGSGPYVINGTGAFLESFKDYRYISLLPADYIYLTQVSQEELIPSFDSGLLDLIIENRNSIGTPEFSAGAERRSYLTTRFHYVGFNTFSGFFATPENRRLVSSLMNRQVIADQRLSDCEAAVLPFPKSYKYYDEQIADGALLTKEAIAAQLSNSLLRDVNGDGVLEIFDSNGLMYTSDLVFIVPKENLKKVNAAKEIAAELRNAGFGITLKELPWEEYTQTLKSGAFDMYYSSIQLSADFSLLPLTDDTGSARFGGYDPTLDALCTNFLAALPGDPKAFAAREMLKRFADTAPIAPIAFEREALLTNRGVISGANPTQYDPYYNIVDWKINIG
ncbi:MAG: ABC transporter substrate-binding protein [Oscillospiraceae bacterium]|jgi:peptide/nickel transport system substrate-binding protein|nr:ABC transporter substrate-binding protein [Oscillospiraceae bacterium]